MAGSVRIELRIKNIIQERGMTQDQFADAVGISRQSINKLASGKQEQILLKTLAKLLESGLTLDDIFKISSD